MARAGTAWRSSAVKANWSGSPTDATGEPSGATTATEPRWTDSTRPPRVTSTSAGGAAADRRGDRPETGTGCQRCAAASPPRALAGRLALALLGGLRLGLSARPC